MIGKILLFISLGVCVQTVANDRVKDERCFEEKTTEVMENLTPRAQLIIGVGIYSTPAIMEDGTVVVGSHDGKVYFLNPDGSKKAEFQTGGGVSSAPAIMEDGTVVVGSRDGKVYFLNPNGSKKAEFQTGGGVLSSPAIMKDGTVVVGSGDGKVYFLNLKDAKSEMVTHLVQIPGTCPDGKTKVEKVYDAPRGHSDDTIGSESAPA